MLNSINAITHFTANYKLFVLQQYSPAETKLFIVMIQHQSGFQHQSFLHEQQIPDAVENRFINSYESLLLEHIIGNSWIGNDIITRI